MFDLIARGEYDTDIDAFQNLSFEAKHLIKEIFEVNQSGRLTATQILKHPWFTGEVLE